MKQFVLLLSVLFISCFSFAQKEVQMDTTTIEARSFSKDAINKFKTDPAFDYDRIVEPPLSWWDRFWIWFWHKVEELLSTRTGRNTAWVVFTTLAVAIIAYFILKVTGMNRGGLFGRSSKSGLNYTVSSDDIHHISFEDAITKAIAAGNYRLATRLLYLQSLKKLSDKEYIQWQINKTNTDYLRETSATKWAPLFSSLTYSFEYAWYGEVPLNKENFNMLQQQFTELNNQL